MNKEIEKTRRATRKVAAILGSFCMIIGIVTIAQATYVLVQGIISNHWPSVMGVITESRIVSHRHWSGQGTHVGITEYHPVISYEYSINNQLYTNHKIFYGAIGGTDINLSTHYTSNFPVAKKVRIYYSPFNYNNSVLIKGQRKTSIAAIIGGLLFLVIGFVVYKLRDFLRKFHSG